MHQSGAETLVTEEPYALIAHVRVCGGAGWATAGSTRQEAALGNGSGWPPVQASPEAFFQRCQSLEWRFFANLYEAFLIQGLPQAQPC